MSKTLVITGGSKGLGWAIVRRFLQSDWFVVSGSRTIRDCKDGEFGNKFLQVEIDVRSPSSHNILVQKALEKTGQVDCFVNNAGFSEWRKIEEIDEDFLTEIMKTNLLGYFWGAQAAAGVMKSGSSLINISSIAAKRGTSNNSAYVATKFGVAGMTQSLCKELGPRGIRVNAVCPVLISTPGLLKALEDVDSPAKGDPSDFLTNFASTQTALGRLPTEEEVSNLVYFLASDQATGITGQSINVDCGVLPN